MTKDQLIDSYLEIGKTRVFAGAIEWPGWCRSGRDAGAGRVAEQLDNAPQGWTPDRRPYVRLIRRPLIVEAENVRDVGPHFEPHQAEIVA